MSEYIPDEILKEAQEFSWDKTEKQENEAAIKPEHVNFSEKNNTVLLDLKESDIDLSKLQQVAESENYDAKSEFHLTVAGFKNGKEIKKAVANFPEAERPAKLAEIQNLINETDWTIKLLPDTYKISKEYSQQNPKTKENEVTETRESIIQMVDATGIHEFYNKLNQVLNTNLEAPPAHITLYTKGTDKEKAKMGIGINSEAELQELNPAKI